MSIIKVDFKKKSENEEFNSAWAFTRRSQNQFVV